MRLSVRFPRGLKPLGYLSHRLGMKFLVWIAPEWTAGGPYLNYLRSNDKSDDRAGMTEIRYVESLYQMWVDARAAPAAVVDEQVRVRASHIDLETSGRPGSVLVEYKRI